MWCAELSPAWSESRPLDGETEEQFLDRVFSSDPEREEENALPFLLRRDIDRNAILAMIPKSVRRRITGRKKKNAKYLPIIREMTEAKKQDKEIVAAIKRLFSRDDNAKEMTVTRVQDIRRHAKDNDEW